MKLFKVHAGTKARVLRNVSGIVTVEEKTVTEELTFELEDVTVDPFHPERLGVKTIGHEYAAARWYGFELKNCGQYSTLLVPMDQVAIWG